MASYDRVRPIHFRKEPLGLLYFAVYTLELDVQIGDPLLESVFHQPFVAHQPFVIDKRLHALEPSFPPRIKVKADLAKLDQTARPIWNEWVAEVTKKGYKGKELLDLMLTTAKSVKTS